MSQSKAYRTKEAIYNYTLGGITLIHSFDELFSYKTTKNMHCAQKPTASIGYICVVKTYRLLYSNAV